VTFAKPSATALDRREAGRFGGPMRPHLLPITTFIALVLCLVPPLALARPLTAEWFRRLSFVQGSTHESLHPNAYGERAIGACLGLLFARPRGDYACTDTPGEFLAGMRLEVTR
jgi:hypothetical protein